MLTTKYFIVNKVFENPLKQIYVNIAIDTRFLIVANPLTRLCLVSKNICDWDRISYLKVSRDELWV